jgi:hypothetical protein
MLRALLPVHRKRILNRAATRTFASERIVDPVCINLPQGLEVGTKALIRLSAILQTLKVRFELSGRLFRQAIDHPGSMPRRFNQPMLTKVCQMLGNFRLRDLKNFLEVTYAKGSLRKKVDDAKPRRVTKALIDLDQVHNRLYITLNIYVNTDMFVRIYN